MSQAHQLIQGSDEWLAFRRGKRMASEVAAMMGKSPYMTPLQLAKVKRGLTETAVNFAMARGTNYEAEARSAFEAETGLLMEPAVISAGDYGASLDGIGRPIYGDGQIIVEIKVPQSENSDLWKAACNGEVPHHYMLQIQQQLFVVGAEFAYFWVYMPETKTGKLITVDHDPKLQKEIRGAWAEWWQQYMIGDLPDDERNDQDWFDACERYRDAKRIYDAATAQLEASKEELIEIAGEKSAKGCGITLSRVEPSGSVKWAEVAKALNPPAELIAKFTTKKTDPTFKVSIKE